MTFDVPTQTGSRSEQINRKGDSGMARSVVEAVGRSRVVLEWRTLRGHEFAVQRLELLKVVLRPMGWAAGDGVPAAFGAAGVRGLAAGRTAAIMTTVAGRAPERSTREELVVPVTGGDELFEITARFRDHGIGVTELSLRLPSLDEVFLALTGTPTTTSDDTPNPTKATR
ncbi:hypothetical protein [Spirillospora sp. CA-128828]|uniref:hypothetical protein n=1 Tax=Spirillospora sp. CA-128828 TaxID=3240033 RepID=UPI003D8AB21F